MKNPTVNILLAVCLVLIVIGLRLAPHPANFAPVAAAAIFGGALLPRRYALSVPLGAMIISDLIIGLHPLVAVTWGSFGLIALASNRWLHGGNLKKGALLTLGSSVFFFVVTNFAVWVQSGMYAHTWSGLVRCYTMALPFFRNTILGDVFYTAALFLVYAMATALSIRVLGADRFSKA